MRQLAAPVVLLLLANLGGCTGRAPPCPYHGPPRAASSAGCLAIVHGRMLVVENLSGKVSPPGGSALQGESAQCTAHRETWEETGLDLLPRQLLRSFSTGFDLYACELHADTGELQPHAPTEVSRAYWLPMAAFDQVQWRFPGQDRELLEMLDSLRMTPP